MRKISGVLATALVLGMATVAAGPAQAAPSKLTVTVTVSGAQTYGATAPTYTYTSSASDGSTGYTLSGTLTCTTSATPTSTVSGGPYPINSCSGLSVAPAADYFVNPTYSLGSVTVTRAPLTVTAPSPSKVYGAAVPALPPTIAGFVNGQTAAALTSQPTCATTATTASGVGTYATTCSGAAAANYSFTYVAGTLTVTKAPLTVTASSGSMTYGGTVPTITPGYADFVNGDGPSAVSGVACSTTATAASAVGKYPSSCSGGSAANYTLSYNNGSVTVGAAVLTVTAPSPTKTYGAAVPALEPVYTGFVNGQTAANLSSPATCSTTATAASAVGSYVVTCSGAAIPNYTVNDVSGSLTVARATITVTAPSTSITYGTAVPELTPSYTGFVNGDTVTALGAGATCSTGATSASDVGDYTVSCSGATAANYAFSYVTGTLSVTRAPLQLTVSGSQVYGGAPHYTYGGSLPADVTVDGAPDCAASGLTVASHVGAYDIASCTGLTLSGPKAGDYSLTLSLAQVHVSPAALTVTAPSPSKVYGAALPALPASFDGLENGDTVVATCSTTATAGSNVGPYAVSCAVTPDADYTITSVPGTLTVTAAPLSISADGTKLYGAATPALTPAYSGLVAGDTATATPAVCTTAADESSDVGSYDVTCSGAADGNYAITYVTGRLAVTPAPLTVTAPSPSKTYGAALPALAAGYTGLVNGQTAPATPATCTTEAISASPVGSYPTSCSGAVDGNYAIDYVGGLLHVVHAPLTVLAPSSTQTYGFGTMPNLLPEYVGLVNGDDAPATEGACTTAAGPGGKAGTYPVTCPGTADPNYTVTDVAGVFVITPAPLTITANDKSITYGEDTPALDATYSGFAYDDGPTSLTGALSCTTHAGLLHAGTYPVSCSGQTSGNYDISYLPGLVTVAKKSVVGGIASDTITYGQAVPALEVTYLGLVGDDTPASLNLPVVGCTDLGSKPSAGSHAVTCDPISRPDYDITFTGGTLTVTKAPLIVKANDASMTYGDPLPALSGAVVTGTPDSSVTGELTCSSDSAAPHFGLHPITCQGLTSPNFQIGYVDGTLTVGKAPLTGQVASASITYGDATPSLALSYTGFKNGDSAGSLGLPSSCAGPTGRLHPQDYPVTCGEVSLDDYDVSVTRGVLTVGKAALTVQVDSHTVVYGQPIPAFGATYDSFVNGDDPSALGGALHCDAPTGVVAAGHYDVTCSGLTSDDYAISYVAGRLTVTTAQLTVTAHNAAMTYGAAVPALTADVTGTAVAGGDASITGTLVCTTDQAAPRAGDHPITCSGLSSPNYEIVYENATLTVGKAPLVGTTNSATITYGQATPAFAPSYSGFVNGDGPGSLGGTVSCNPPSGAVHVGNYAVHCGGQTSSDYDISYVDGALTVNPAALTGQTDSRTMTYGGTVPSFGVTFTGYQYGDDDSALTGTLSCGIPSPLHAGSYDVTCTGRTGSDYLISYLPGTLTVNKAVVTGAVPDRAMTYGGALPSFPVAYSGLVAPDTANALGLPATCAGPATVHVGSYSVACAATSTADYTVGYTPGTLTVNPATATVTAPNATRLAGQVNPTFTPAYAFVNGETAGVLTTPATCSSPATASSPPGSYPITCSGAAAADYVFSYVAGTLTVKVTMQIKAFGQPINDPAGTAPSVLKGGSTLPVKFQVTDLSGALLPDAAAQAIADGCNAKISYGFVSGSVGATNESPYNDTPSSGSCFRYDATAHQFIYNLSTKAMLTGSWTLRATVTMSDSSVISHEVNIGIR